MAWKLCFALSNYAVRLFLLHGALGDTDAAYYNEDQLGRKMIFTWYYHTFAILLCLACTLGTFFLQTSDTKKYGNGFTQRRQMTVVITRKMTQTNKKANKDSAGEIYAISFVLCSASFHRLYYDTVAHTQ